MKLSGAYRGAQHLQNQPSRIENMSLTSCAQAESTAAGGDILTPARILTSLLLLPLDAQITSGRAANATREPAHGLNEVVVRQRGTKLRSQKQSFRVKLRRHGVGATIRMSQATTKRGWSRGAEQLRFEPTSAQVGSRVENPLSQRYLNFGPEAPTIHLSGRGRSLSVELYKGPALSVSCGRVSPKISRKRWDR